MDDEAFKARILAAGPGEIVELPEGWTLQDFAEWAAAGNLDDILDETPSRLLFMEAKERRELH